MSKRTDSHFPAAITIGEKYGPAMKITDPVEASAYFERCVLHCMSFGRSRSEAESIERSNLGYWAGYYDEETRARVERLFRCEHPVFGAIAVNGPPSAEEAFRAGVKAAESAAFAKSPTTAEQQAPNNKEPSNEN